MCGISGLLSPSLAPRELEARLAQMGAKQRHRGPDDQGEQLFSLSKGYLGLGLVRLAILDLETGMQPIVCPEDGSAIVCNGQIYNYLELRQKLQGEPFQTQGDIEVALRLYRQQGLSFLHELNGMYGGAIFDPREGRLLLFRDRFGIKPLYYSQQGEHFLFASEIKALLSSGLVPASLNRRRLRTYFSYRYVPGAETLFDGVYRVPPGSYLSYDLARGSFEVRRYWEYRLDQVRPDWSEEEAEETFFSLLQDAVRLRLRSDVEVGTFLSGGIDSSAVTALAADFQPGIRTFTVGFARPEYDERAGVRAFLEAFPQRFAPSTHHFRTSEASSLERLPSLVQSVDEPLGLAAMLPTDEVCALAGEQLKVVLTGEGADEIFAGYRKFLLEDAASRFEEYSRTEQKELSGLFPELEGYRAIRHSDPRQRYIQSELLFSPEELDELLGEEGGGGTFSEESLSRLAEGSRARVPQHNGGGLPEESLPLLSGEESALGAMQAMECRFRLPDYVILRLDKLSMRHSLETRTPFLDYRLAEFAGTLPGWLKVRPAQGLDKWLCRTSFERRGLLDRATIQRRKQPFTAPWADWLLDRQQRPAYLREILEGDLLQKQGVLNPLVVSRIQKRVSAQEVVPATLVSEADRILAVCVFALWYQTFLQGSP